MVKLLVNAGCRFTGHVADFQTAEVDIGQFPFRHDRQFVIGPAVGASAFHPKLGGIDQGSEPAGVDAEVGAGGGRNIGHFRYPQIVRSPLRLGG